MSSRDRTWNHTSTGASPGGASRSEDTADGLARRDFLKLGAMVGASTIVGGAAMADPAAGRSQTGGTGSNSLDLTMAGYLLDHVRPLADGLVPIEGCNLHFQSGKIGDLNTHVLSGPQELDVTEIGLSPFMLAYANEGFRDYSLLPVFPVRLFRHRSVFVHAGRGIEKPEDLRGRRIGTPGYSSTSLTWIRGIMQHEYGVRPEDVEWVVSAADSSAGDSGTVSKQESVIPEGISVTVGPPGRDESELLVAGDVDALFHAAEPRAFVEGHPEVRRLFPDPRTTERDYFARMGIFPIMHAVAIRNDLVEAHPWLSAAVFDAYSEAKRLHYADMRMKWIFGTLPWFGQEFDETRALMGENFWPYGVEANRKALDTLFQYSYEQGLAAKRLTVEELFHPSTLQFAEAY